MNLILISKDDFTGENRVRLQDRRLSHLLQIHKAAVSDIMTVGLLNGPVGRGRVINIQPEAVEMEVLFELQPPPAIPVTLILSLPRPKMLKRVLFAASSMGVKKIYLINSYRVEKSYWQSPLLIEEKMREYLMLGLEQARDTIMPEVLQRPLFKPFLEDELPGIVGDSVALVADPEAETDCPRNINNSITLAIGPEGGFIPYEVNKFSSIGFKPVSLGQRPLRVETVVPALLSRLF